ncbi:acetyl-CoA-benzylalcohol acetyltransferase-like, partial [Fagus crenata]
MHPKINGAPIITRRFVFNGAAISSLKAITTRQPSRVVVVTALIGKALIDLAQARHSHLRDSVICHSLNLRGKTALPIPDNSFGNLYMVTNTQVGGKDIESKVEFHDLVRLLQDSIG